LKLCLRISAFLQVADCQAHANQQADEVQAAESAVQSRKIAVQAAQQHATTDVIRQLHSGLKLLNSVKQCSREVLSSQAAGVRDGSDLFISAFSQAVRSADSLTASKADASLAKLTAEADSAFSSLTATLACLATCSPLASAVGYLVKVFKLGHTAYAQGLSSWPHFCKFLASVQHKQRIVEAMPSLQQMQEGLASSASAVLASTFSGQDSASALQAVGDLLRYRLLIESKLTELGSSKAVEVEFRMVDKFVLELAAASSHYVATQQHVGHELLDQIAQVRYAGCPCVQIHHCELLLDHRILVLQKFSSQIKHCWLCLPSNWSV
jgi:hypothetical protein